MRGESAASYLNSCAEANGTRHRSLSWAVECAQANPAFNACVSGLQKAPIDGLSLLMASTDVLDLESVEIGGECLRRTKCGLLLNFWHSMRQLTTSRGRALAAANNNDCTAPCLRRPLALQPDTLQFPSSISI